MQPQLKKINWSHVIEIDRHIYDTLNSKVKLMLSALYLLFFERFNVDNNKNNVSFLFLKSMKRNDYDKLFNTIAEQCHSSKKIIDLISRRSIFPKLYPFFIAIKYFKVFLILDDKSFYKKFYIFIKILHYLEVYEKINNNFTFNTIVVFADMQPIDNLLVQMFRLSGKNTVTLQHGLYIDYSKYPNINSINYTNSVAEFFLAWGVGTVALINEYHPKTIVYICGKPLENEDSQVTSEDYFTVIFDQNLLRSYNVKMLEIAYQLQDMTQLKANIRFHPRNNPKSYRVRASCLVNQSIGNSKFIIAHTTSMIHELMRVGKAVYKFDTDIPSIHMPDDLKFLSAEELVNKLKKQSNHPDYFSEFAKYHIKFIGNDSLKKYREFFEMINEANI